MPLRMFTRRVFPGALAALGWASRLVAKESKQSKQSNTPRAYFTAQEAEQAGEYFYYAPTHPDAKNPLDYPHILTAQEYDVLWYMTETASCICLHSKDGGTKGRNTWSFLEWNAPDPSWLQTTRRKIEALPPSAVMSLLHTFLHDGYIELHFVSDDATFYRIAERGLRRMMHYKAYIKRQSGVNWPL